MCMRDFPTYTSPRVILVVVVSAELPHKAQYSGFIRCIRVRAKEAREVVDVPACEADEWDFL